ncbi:MAG: phenylalanine--tRNA ligase subunit alpha, partial [Mucinivorans sp.]
MKSKIEQFQRKIEELVANNAEQAEALRIEYLGRNGHITKLFDEFKALSPELKREVGASINALKVLATTKIEELKASAGRTAKSNNDPLEQQDLTRPAAADRVGTRHPISLVKQEILDIFHRIGFATASGPEIEDDFHVFQALNFPANHPARDMQDTFFVDKDILLRTHTSSIQVRVMQSQKPPIRVVCPGRVFRNEAISYRAHCIFHQVEGLFIDENVTFADLKQTIEYFAKECFGEQSRIRIRPSYFPFTEPSTEIDVSCNLCGGKGCPVCKGTGWLEIMGAGMVDPAVLDSCGID